jgi:sugar lactone lactonase YvrE
MQVPLDGGTPITLASNLAAPTGIAIDNTRVYWTNQGAVLSVPINGGAVEAIAPSEPGAFGIAVDSTHVYWVDSESLMVRRAAKDIGNSTETLTDARWPYGIAVDAKHAYWTNHNDANDGGTVMAVAVDGGPPTTIASGTENAWYISVDADAVYWATRTEIMKATLDGSKVDTLAELANPNGIALSATDVYWAAQSVGDAPPAI